MAACSWSGSSVIRTIRYSSNSPPGNSSRAKTLCSARRELREETGYAGATARLLGSVHPNPAIQANRCHFVFVDGATRAHGCEWDTDEEIEVVALPVAEALGRARDGGITHGLVLNALMLFEAEWRARGGGGRGV